MKIINKIFRATKKDGSLEKVLTKLPENPNGYSGIVTNIDQSFMDRTLKGLSECDEDMHPTMFVPLSFFFLKTPMDAKDIFDRQIGEETFLSRFLREFIDGVQDWVYWNDDLANELYDLCDGVVKTRINETYTLVKNINITPEIEDKFLNSQNYDVTFP